MPGFWRKLLLVTALGVGVFAVFSIHADVEKLGARLGQMDKLAVLAALALAATNYALRFIRWQLYLRATGMGVPTKASALVFLSGFAMSVTPGKVGELFKAGLLSDAAGAPAGKTIPIVIAERVTDLVSLVLLALAGVVAYGIATEMAVAGVAVVGAGMVILSWRSLAEAVLGLVERLGRIGRKLAPKLRELYTNVATLVRPRPLAWGTALGLVAWLAECVGFALVVRGLPGAYVSAGLATLIYAATTIAGALSFLPGGLVVTELGMISLLVRSAEGLDQPAAVAATIVIRICTLWFAVALGLVALALVRRAFPAAAERVEDRIAS